MIRRARKATQLATGILILAFAFRPLAAQQRQAPAQRGGPPRADTPQLLVSVLASSDRKAGVEAADAIRKRIQDEHSAADLYIVPQSTVDAMLRSCGYNPDHRSERTISSSSRERRAATTRSTAQSSARRPAFAHSFAC